MIAYHRGEIRLTDRAIDRLLGIRPDLGDSNLFQANDYFARQKWLAEITPGAVPARRFGLRLFATRG